MYNRQNNEGVQSRRWDASALVYEQTDWQGTTRNARLARPGVEYVAYFPRGGANDVELQAGTYAVEWLHPETGLYSSEEAITVAGGSVTLHAPGAGDWVLHWTASSP